MPEPDSGRDLAPDRSTAPGGKAWTGCHPRSELSPHAGLGSLRHLGHDASLLSAWFPMPKVAIFTGHIIDQPGRPLRFPHSQIDAVRTRLAAILEQHHIGIGFSAAACGGDLLFLDALQQRDGETFIVLPLPEEQFIKASVAVDPQRDWLADMQRAMQQATQVTIVNDFSREKIDASVNELAEELEMVSDLL